MELKDENRESSAREVQGFPRGRVQSKEIQKMTLIIIDPLGVRVRAFAGQLTDRKKGSSIVFVRCT